MLDNNKLMALCSRVYGDEMIEKRNEKGEIEISDEKDIQALCEKVFGDGTVSPDPSMLHMFNNLIVKVADKEAKPQIDQLMKVLANYQTAKPGDVIAYKVTTKNKVRVKWSALGTGVDLIRISPSAKTVPAVGVPFKFGAYYEPLDMVRNSVEGFKTAVKAVAEAKVKFYYDKVRELVAKAIADNDIPANNQLIGSNVTIADYRKLESRMLRFGGRPTLIADRLLIDHLAMQQATDSTLKTLLTDSVRESLLSDIDVDAFSKTVAVSLTNPFTDEANSKVELPIEEGYLFAGGEGQKSPFNITEFGGLRQVTEQDAEDGRIKLMLTQEADISLMSGQAIAYIQDDTIVL